MTTTLKTLLAVVAGMTLALALVIGVELFGEAVHPIPAALQDNIPEHVRNYPDWILGVVVPAWGATALAATWVATRIGHRIAGFIVAAVLTLAVTFNLTALPYTMWFKVVMFVVVPLACVLGIRSGDRRRQARDT